MSPKPGFDQRLAFARWLEGRGRLVAESDAQFAERAGVGYQWFAKWRKRPDAPDDRKLTAKLVAALGVSGEWLLDGLGDAPRADLWQEWVEAYNRQAKAPSGRMKKALVPAPKSAEDKGKGRGGA